MSNRLSIIVSVLLTVLLVYLFVIFFEYVDEEVDVGWRLEAKNNPYLALSIYSEKQGVPVDSVDSYLKLDSLDAYDTLLLASSGQVISDSRLEEILNWVEAGGHLIVAADASADWKNDRLCDYFDLLTEETDFEGDGFDDEFFEDLTGEQSGDEDSELTDEQKKEQRRKKLLDELRQYNEELKNKGLMTPDEKEEKTYREKIAEYEARVDAAEITTLNFNDIESKLRIHFDPSLALDHPALRDTRWDKNKYDTGYWESSEYGVHFMQLEKGQGLVSVFSDASVLRSENIDKFDHAYLWDVLSGGKRAAIVFGSNMPSLWFMLWAFMPEVLVALGVFIIAWIWFSMRRFGPIREWVIRERRSSSEHIAASAGYLWRGEWQEDLLTPVRKDVVQLAEKRLSGYEEANANLQMSMLASAAGINADLVTTAMTSEEKLNEDNFYRTVRILQRIRESL